jgi:uncharacterized tellurite resistance protein B-like protein
MHVYSPNSPEAMSRVVAMMIVADAHIDDREIAILDKLNAFAALGISRKDFMAVARDYCADLGRLAEAEGSTTLLDPARTDQIIGAVTDPAQRLVVAKLLMAVVAADHHHGEGELVLIAHILDVWSLTRDQVANAA